MWRVYVEGFKDYSLKMQPPKWKIYFGPRMQSFRCLSPSRIPAIYDVCYY